MKTLSAILAGVLALAFTTAASAADDTKKLLVGKWEAVKADEGTLPVGAIVEMTADGKLKVTPNKDAKDETVEGTYTVDKMSFTYKIKFGEMEQMRTITINKLTETELETTNPDKKSVTFKKLK